jgi:hypothetical protein
MKRLLPLCLVLLSLIVACNAAAQASAEHEVPPPPVAEHYSSGKPPPSGIGGIVLGAVGLGLGAINLASIPICHSSLYPANAADLCFGLSIGLGAALVGVGIPSLIVGIIRRKRYKEWRSQRVAQRGIDLDNVKVAPLLGGGQLLLRASF